LSELVSTVLNLIPLFVNHHWIARGGINVARHKFHGCAVSAGDDTERQPPREVFMPHIDSTTGRQTPRSNAWRSAITVLQEAEPPFIPAGAHAMTIVVEFPPGDPGTPPHRHPGPAFGYVLDGEMVFEIEGEPERVVRAGEAFWEPGGDVIHYQDGNNRDDIPVRYTVTMLCEPGKPMLTLVDDDELAERKSRRAPHAN
jgi:quercetin dioxygenase-like cupin family protein